MSVCFFDQMPEKAPERIKNSGQPHLDQLFFFDFSG